MTYEIRQEVVRENGRVRYLYPRPKYLIDGMDVTDQPLAPAHFDLIIQRACDQPLIDYARRRMENRS